MAAPAFVDIEIVILYPKLFPIRAIAVITQISEAHWCSDPGFLLRSASPQ
jgi:hypothetical protein